MKWRGCTRTMPCFEAGKLWHDMGLEWASTSFFLSFSYPLPEPLVEIREAIHPKLAPIANRWNEAMGIAVHCPQQQADFLDRCHEAGQTRLTPLLLQYGTDDYNCLHQHLHGEDVFPLQVAVLLSEPGADFMGGEFVLTVQRPRMQTRAMMVGLRQGDAVVFVVDHRPVKETRATYRVNLRHGVSRILSGRRHTLGIIFYGAAEAWHLASGRVVQ